MARSLAIDQDGNLSYCSVPPEMRGMRGCPHVGHQDQNESSEDFIKRITVESNAHKWREKAEKRLGESDEKYRARLEFNKALTEYEKSDFPQTDEDHRTEIESEYGVENKELQDKALTILGAIHEGVSNPDFHEKNKALDLRQTTPQKLRELAPDLPEDLAQDIIHYRDSYIDHLDGYKVEKDGESDDYAETITSAASLKDARSIAEDPSATKNPYERNADPRFQAYGWGEFVPTKSPEPERFKTWDEAARSSPMSNEPGYEDWLKKLDSNMIKEEQAYLKRSASSGRSFDREDTTGQVERGRIGLKKIRIELERRREQGID